MFLADDLGWTDWQRDEALNPRGSVVYETPNLLRLAGQGVTFSEGYSSAAVCSPTRAALLTGKSPARLRIADFIPGSGNGTGRLRSPEWMKDLPLEETTLPERLRDTGYTTGFVGKWHLGQRNRIEADPLQHGFDSQVGGTYVGSPNRSGGFFAGDDGERDQAFWHYPHRSPQDFNTSQIVRGNFYSAVREGDWKLIYTYNNEAIFLFDLSEDLGETSNLANSEPQVRDRLLAELRDWLIETDAQMPIERSTGLPTALPASAGEPRVDRRRLQRGRRRRRRRLHGLTRRDALRGAAPVGPEQRRAERHHRPALLAGQLRRRNLRCDLGGPGAEWLGDRPVRHHVRGVAPSVLATTTATMRLRLTPASGQFGRVRCVGQCDKTQSVAAQRLRLTRADL